MYLLILSRKSSCTIRKPVVEAFELLQNYSRLSQNIHFFNLRIWCKILHNLATFYLHAVMMTICRSVMRPFLTFLIVGSLIIWSFLSFLEVLIPTNAVRFALERKKNSRFKHNYSPFIMFNYLLQNTIGHWNWYVSSHCVQKTIAHDQKQVLKSFELLKNSLILSQNIHFLNFRIWCQMLHNLASFYLQCRHDDNLPKRNASIFTNHHRSDRWSLVFSSHTWIPNSEQCSEVCTCRKRKTQGSNRATLPS